MYYIVCICRPTLNKLIIIIIEMPRNLLSRVAKCVLTVAYPLLGKIGSYELAVAPFVLLA